MKRYYAAAGALLLGTSALAWAGDTGKTVVEPVKPTTTADMTFGKSDMSWDKTTLASKTEMSGDSKFAFSSLDKQLAPLATAETNAKLQTASLENSKVETTWSDTDKVQTAWSDSGSKVETVSTDKVGTGMGGPLEEASASTVQPSNANPELDARGIPVISDPAFVPTGFNGTGGAVGGPVEAGDNESYPACTREVTDNCIQLYERGVRSSLDDDASTTTAAVGGPYEPVDADSDLAMNGDGIVDSGKGETGATELAMTAVPTDTAVASHSEHQGVGGPVEAQSGYPPCSPGPGDDRCIQLYEPGVTGAGN